MVMIQMFSLCVVWGEPLSQTAQSFMPELMSGADRNLPKARMLLKSLLIIGFILGLTLGTVGTCVPWLFPNIFTSDAMVIQECLSRALRNENPELLMLASALAFPVQPLMGTAVHTGMMELAFAKRAVKDPDLKAAHNLHTLSSVLGGALFIADNVYPNTLFFTLVGILLRLLALGH